MRGHPRAPSAEIGSPAAKSAMVARRARVPDQPRRSFNTRRGPTAGSARSWEDSFGRRGKLRPGETSRSLLPPVRRPLRSFSKAACNIRQGLCPISWAHQAFRRGPRNKSRGSWNNSRPRCNVSKPLRAFQRGSVCVQRPCELLQRPLDLLKRGLLVLRRPHELFQRSLVVLK